MEHVYNRRRGELGSSDPLSRAIQEKKLSKEKALTFAWNWEGRVWIGDMRFLVNDQEYGRVRVFQTSKAVAPVKYELSLSIR